MKKRKTPSKVLGFMPLSLMDQAIKKLEKQSKRKKK